MYPAAPSNIINECGVGAARTMNRAVSETRNWQVCFFDCFQRFTRFWGVFTSVGEFDIITIVLAVLLAHNVD